MALLVIDCEPTEARQSDNDNLSQIAELTREVVAVQYHAVGNSSLHIESQVNVFARDTLGLLRTLGAKKDRVHELVEYLYQEDPYELEKAVGKVGVATVSLMSSLCTDFYESTRDCLVNIIRDPNEFAAIPVDVTNV